LNLLAEPNHDFLARYGARNLLFARIGVKTQQLVAGLNYSYVFPVIPKKDRRDTRFLKRRGVLHQPIGWGDRLESGGFGPKLPRERLRDKDAGRPFTSST